MSGDLRAERVLTCIVFLVRRLNCSQEPQLMQLQQNLYEQLTDNNPMPKDATKSAASQIRELIKSAKGKLVLLVLDGGSDACNDDTRNVSSHICVRA